MKYLMFISLVALFSSCSDQELVFDSNETMQAYINDADNGYIQRLDSKDMHFDAKLVPALKDDTSRQITVHLRISSKENASVLDYGKVMDQERLQREGYLSFEVIKDVFLECDDIKISPVFHHYERNYGLKPELDMFFNFDNVRPESDVYFAYRDQLFDQGLVRIKFNKQLFNNCYVKRK